MGFKALQGFEVETAVTFLQSNIVFALTTKLNIRWFSKSNPKPHPLFGPHGAGCMGIEPPTTPKNKCSTQKRCKVNSFNAKTDTHARIDTLATMWMLAEGLGVLMSLNSYMHRFKPKFNGLRRRGFLYHFCLDPSRFHAQTYKLGQNGDSSSKSLYGPGNLIYTEVYNIAIKRKRRVSVLLLN